MVYLAYLRVAANNKGHFLHILDAVGQPDGQLFLQIRSSYENPGYCVSTAVPVWRYALLVLRSHTVY